MEYIIQASGIVKKFSDHTALDHVDIKIPKGSIYGLLGPNGAGKTTFIRLVNQITKPDQGEILYKGEPLDESHIAKIGYLPEERGLYKKMKVGEQAIYLAQLKGMTADQAKSKLKDWFEKFDIMEWWDKRVEDLSKGMAQKIQFIVTVLHEPEILILDEPFSGFDPLNTELIKQEILELKKKGTTIIFSTHNMQSVEEICSYITLIDHSKVILQGNLKVIRTRFSDKEYQIHFEGNMISFTTALWTGFELIDSKSINNNEHIVQVRPINKVPLNNLLGAVIGSCKIKSVTEKKASMNDIFIRAVEENKKSLEVEEGGASNE